MTGHSPHSFILGIAKLGFQRALLAKRQQERLGEFPGLELLGVETLAAAIRKLFP